jgi:LAO/AO transport system kinase
MQTDSDEFVRGVRARDRRILAKAITLIESSLPRHQDAARALLDRLMAETGGAVRLGITGVPGAGKSTFIESLGLYLAEQEKSVAVLAVDPSSRRSGGSVLADKTRMQRLSGVESAFIRPSPSGGTLGGVARKTRESMLLCEAAGFDVVIVETVGVGQSETAVASMVDFFLVLMIPGAGDEIQGIKKGILELADAVAVNKADGDNLSRARRAQQDYAAALHLLRPSSPTWTVPVLTCSARDMTGIAEVWDTVCEYCRKMSRTGELEDKRRSQALEWMWSLVDEGLKEDFHAHPSVRELLPGMTREVSCGRVTPAAAALRLLGCMKR